MLEKKVVKARSIVLDSLSGLTDAELMTKYQLSFDQFQKVREELFDGGKVYTAAIVADIRARLTDFELMDKYSLSLEDLEEVLEKLVNIGAIRSAELQERSSLYDNPANRVCTRRYPRIHVPIRLPIHDAADLSREGIIRDVSDHGLRVASYNSSIGEVKKFLVPGGTHSNIDAFEFAVESRWFREKGTPPRYYLAGFEITTISDQARRELGKLIAILALDKRGAKR